MSFESGFWGGLDRTEDPSGTKASQLDPESASPFCLNRHRSTAEFQVSDSHASHLGLGFWVVGLVA